MHPRRAGLSASAGLSCLALSVILLCGCISAHTSKSTMLVCVHETLLQLLYQVGGAVTVAGATVCCQ